MSGVESVAVIVFGHARPVHLENLLCSLFNNEEAAGLPVYVRIDGPRNGSEKSLTNQSARVAERYVGRDRVSTSETNHGLKISLVQGISEVLASYEQVIVLEDDLILSRYFLRFMLDGLSMYGANPAVASIHGYVLPNVSVANESFFLRGADCWGWATWREAWEQYREDATGLLNELREQNMEYDFSFGGVSPHLRLLESASEGFSQSWAILWHASTYLQGRLTLYPGTSLVSNQGHEGSGTHSVITSAYDSAVASAPLRIVRQPVEVSAEAWRGYSQFYKWRKKTKRRDHIALRLRTYRLRALRRLGLDVK